MPDFECSKEEIARIDMEFAESGFQCLARIFRAGGSVWIVAADCGRRSLTGASFVFLGPRCDPAVQAQAQARGLLLLFEFGGVGDDPGVSH